METDINDHYTLITGASLGIGKQLAIEFARKKNNLFLVALPKTELEKFSEELHNEYLIDVKYLNTDLLRYKAPQKVYDYAKANNIVVNILVNNVGIGYKGEFGEMTLKEIDSTLLLNVRVLTLLTYCFLPEMKKLRKAYILNISSFAGMSPIPYKSIYSASKGYIWYFSQSLNVELKKTNIKVLSVYPSGVRTERTFETIKKSSVFARITCIDPDEVAVMAVSSLFKNKKILIPGFFTKLYYVIGWILPQGLVLKLSSHIFRKYA